MKKNTILALTVVFSLVAVGLSIFLYYSIKGPIEEKKEIAELEARIIEKLKLIREVQKMHIAVKGYYAFNFDELDKFIEKGKVPIVVMRDSAISADESIIVYDTLAIVAVKDTLTKLNKANLDLARLRKIPGKEDASFSMLVSPKLALSGDTIYAIQVSDVAPIRNPKRKENPLRFGSLADVSIRGNWEF
jgi:ABC-type Na+ efflux pump permease subunit